ncbi:class I SAM-dependent methyltransferase [Spirochaeta cellobiosiphila]|uniref:class I SAM-dependent methyltransferase n=1 Tax=Spirochaeta cellobiosiphila TaxID=504483 RepID=UPI00040F5F88|nr:class I SAM-dependent methyltransferase [Spirochaeta cellobiosiphila]
MKWKSELYDSKHNFVSQYGAELIEMLNPGKGERILDLGCGTGDLANQISQEGAHVVGIDSSKDMLKSAKEKYPHLTFENQRAEDFHFDQSFDGVFSNAALHWVLEKEKAAQSIYHCLKPGGRFVAEFGGQGNVSHVLKALCQSLKKEGYEDHMKRQKWYFPSLGEYSTLLEGIGFRVVYAKHFDRPTVLSDQDGLRNWIAMFCSSFLEGIGADKVEVILKDVEEKMVLTNYREGQWYADYVRLRIVATKEPVNLG